MSTKPDENQKHIPKYCKQCGEEFNANSVFELHQRKQEVVIPPIIPKFIEHQSYGCTCSKCNTQTITGLPSHLKANIQWYHTLLSIMFVILLSIEAYSQQKTRVNKIWRDSIKNYVKPIKSLDSNDYSDLLFLKPILEDKPYVFLGESSHEIEEYFQIKNRLVQFLYKEMGYKIIAFEGYKAICLEVNNVKNEISIDSLFTYIFPYTTNRLMLKPKGGQSLISFCQKNNMQVTGFDIDLERSIRFQKIIKQHFIDVPDSILIQDSIIITNYNKEKGLAFKAWESILYDTSIFNLHELHSQELHDAIINRTNWLYSMPNNTPTKRDSVMARNIMRLIRDFYPNEKIIFWAHNWHISKYNPKHIVMNELLPDTIINKSYILGLYAYQGSTGVRDSGPVNLVKNKKNSLGAIMNSAGYEIAFCDFSRQKKCPSNSWMYKKIKTISWAVQRPVIVPSKRYDGIIQIKNVHATVNFPK